MKHLAGAVLALTLAAAPVRAQETVPLPIRIDGPATIAVTLVKTERRDDEPEQRATLRYEALLSGAMKEDGRRSLSLASDARRWREDRARRIPKPRSPHDRR